METRSAMTHIDIAYQRLHHQGLVGTPFQKPEDVVQWQGAVQAQDYAGATWALALRSHALTADQIEQAFTDGALLRTHVLRPTWHFVTPADIRWLLALTAPRVHAANAYMYRKLEIDAAVKQRTQAALVRALQDGTHRTREEVRAVLEQAGITTTGALRFGYLLMQAELDGLICSGPRRGNQFTYTLLEERVPPTASLDRDEALGELTRRYFTSHGPATLRDFVVWSGLTLADARRGIAQVTSRLEQVVIEDQTYWSAGAVAPTDTTGPIAHLLPNYDEYFIGFKDRSAISELVKTSALDAQSTALAGHIIILNGQVVGGWKRTLTKQGVVVACTLVTALTQAQTQSIVVAAQRYAAFLEHLLIETSF
jgi:hypothetical protein